MSGVVRGAKAAYDAVARAYDSALGDELSRKPLDRALLECFTELVGSGILVDVGCGPGHVTRFLAERHFDVIGIDLSPEMIAVARERAPTVTFEVGSMLDLPVAAGGWAGIVALYSIIHLTAEERVTACHEFARVLRPGGWLLLAFHIDSAEFAVGEARHITDWFGESVDLHTFFLDPSTVMADIESSQFTVVSTVTRAPWPGADEYPSRRCYVIAQRGA